MCVNLFSNQLIIVDTGNEALKNNKFVKYLFNVQNNQIVEATIDNKNKKFLVFSKSND